MKEICVFTDGSSTVYQDKNGYRYGGYSVYFPNRERRHIQVSCKGKKNKVSNQRMELKACLEALKLAEKVNGYHATIYTDSKYSINTITKWSKEWEKKGWKKADGKVVCNLDIIKEISKVYGNAIANGNKIDFIHVRAHKKEPSKGTHEHFLWHGNNRADKIAREAMEMRRNKSVINVNLRSNANSDLH